MKRTAARNGHNRRENSAISPLMKKTRKEVTNTNPAPAPPIAILGRIAGTFRRLAPDHRGIPAVLALIGTIGAIVGTAVAVLA